MPFFEISCFFLFFLCFFCFFQAEDGIRDLVRSRGLGDVYKRQAISHRLGHFVEGVLSPDAHGRCHDPGYLDVVQVDTGAVSYTHLTLPTSDLV